MTVSIVQFSQGSAEKILQESFAPEASDDDDDGDGPLSSILRYYATMLHMQKTANSSLSLARSRKSRAVKDKREKRTP